MDHIDLIREVLEAWLGTTILPVVLDPLAESLAEAIAQGAPALVA